MTPEAIVDKMMTADWFSQWLGIEILSVADGACALRMTVRKEMLNGFGIAHGGITYSLADSALAFASNSKGRHSLSIDTSIAHVKSLKEGDVIRALGECVTETDKLGHYKVEVTRESDAAVVALFKGLVFKTPAHWQP
jgi:acyl-CoA thioesterase